jgi:Carotenoid biosynthesis protein
MESIMNATNPHDERRRALVPATALAATSLDLMLDPCGLDLGLWEWSGDGHYAAEVEGPNGKRGVPLLNFAGWLCLITSVTLAYRLLEPARRSADTPSPWAAGGSQAGRVAALLLLSYYLPPAAWTLKRRRPNYLVYSAPFALAMWTALR